MKEVKNIAILGSTGSIGTQTLDIIAEYPQHFRAYLLTANKNVDLLIEQSKKYLPNKVVIADDSLYPQLKEALSGYPIEVASGSDAIAESVCDSKIHTVVTAMVGYSGLEPTINAIKSGKTNVDDILLETGLKIFEVMPALTSLEIKNLLVKNSASEYSLIK